ncbi:MAG: hypothetical protein KF889_12955 [Alphaproteobacteria bacterium]|nr:hypothetical protein [Alphaproteobacteria bacterium]
MELDTSSRAFADRLFQAFPEWRAFARVDGENGAATGHLVVEVPPTPQSRMTEGLCVSTAGEEVTVFVEAYHQHFWWPTGDADADDDDPIAFIREVLAESLVVVSWWNEGEWLASTVQPASEAVEPWEGRERATHMRVRSWNATFDKDVAAFLDCSPRP